MRTTTQPAAAPQRTRRTPAANPCGGAEVWAAASVPTTGAGPRTDRRADSRLRLYPLGGGAERAGALWWYTLLAKDVGPGSACALPPAALSPRPPDATEFVAARFGRPCADGAPAASCVSPFSAAAPLRPATDTVGTGYEGDMRVYSIAPVLPGGWVLLGEQAKYVAVSPQRLAAARAPPPPGDGSDAAAPDEFAGPQGGVAFGVLGAPGEAVDVAVLAPPPGGGSSAATVAAAGTVRVVHVAVPESGRAEVACHAAGCTASA